MGKYDKIINMQHYVSPNRQKMSLLDRASQFAPFAALNGYEESIFETGRLTEEKINLTNEAKEVISYKLKYVYDNKIDEDIEITYFVADKKKSGGTYKRYSGVIKRINEVEKKIYFIDKTIIDIEQIIDIRSNTIERIFSSFE